MSTDSEIETSVDPTTRPPEAVADDLGAAIAATEEYERFVETKTAVEESQAAQEKVREFERLRDAFVRARQAGEATEADRETLLTAQRELHAIPEMAAFLTAQKELDARLERLNTALSTDLAVDFGDRIGSCCQD